MSARLHEYVSKAKVKTAVFKLRVKRSEFSHVDMNKQGRTVLLLERYTNESSAVRGANVLRSSQCAPLFRQRMLQPDKLGYNPRSRKSAKKACADGHQGAAFNRIGCYYTTNQSVD